MAGKEIRIYGEDESAIRIRPYEHHAKYYETDQMGIIHHSNYIKWMEEARMDLMEQIGLSYKQMEEMEIISPVLSVSCEYHSMVHFDECGIPDDRQRDRGAAHNGKEFPLLFEPFRQTDFLKEVLSGDRHEVF